MKGGASAPKAPPLDPPLVSTMVGRNPMNIHGVITDYLPKIRSKVCHAHRVNRLKERVENCYVDGVTIVGVPFCGLKGIRHRGMTQNPTCVTITRSIIFMNKKNY